MYSYEERKKAVELYIKYDKSACAVIRELGYPSSKMLKNWYQEYQEHGDLHEKFRLGYSSAQRAVAVHYYQEHGRGLNRTVRALGYPCRQLLGKWVQEDLPENDHPLKRGRSVVQYTDKQKMDAVVSIASGKKTAKELEAEMGVTRSAVSQWKRQLLGEGNSPKMVKKHANEPEKDSAQHISNLRTECDSLREERGKLQKLVFTFYRIGVQLSQKLLFNLRRNIKTSRRRSYGIPDIQYFFLKIMDASRRPYRQYESHKRLC